METIVGRKQYLRSRIHELNLKERAQRAKDPWVLPLAAFAIPAAGILTGHVWISVGLFFVAACFSSADPVYSGDKRSEFQTRLDELEKIDSV